jgi:hypothetical protein
MGYEFLVFRESTPLSTFGEGSGVRVGVIFIYHTINLFPFFWRGKSEGKKGCLRDGRLGGYEDYEGYEIYQFITPHS